MMQNKPLLFGIVGLVVLAVIAIFGPYLPFVDSSLEETKYMRIDGKLTGPPYQPSKDFLMGSDPKGRDLLSLIVLGARETLIFIILIAIVRYLIAIPLAILGFKGSSWFSWIIVKWNQVLTNLPTLLLAIFLLYIPFFIFSESRVMWVLLILGAIEAGRVSYIIQEQLQGLSSSRMIESGVAVGHSSWGLLKRYYLPHLLPQLSVQFMLDIGKIMLLLGQLGFLSIFIAQKFIEYDIGIGMIVNESVAWPQLLADTRNYIRNNVWLPFWPSFAIALTVFTFNLLGEGLRQYFDHKTTTRYNAKLAKQVVEEIAREKQLKAKEQGQSFTVKA